MLAFWVGVCHCVLARDLGHFCLHMSGEPWCSSFCWSKLYASQSVKLPNRMLRDGGKLKILFGVQEARHSMSHSIRLLKISRLGKSVEKDRRVWTARTQRVAVGNDSLSCCYNMALKMSSFTRESLITHGSGSFCQVVMSGEELLTEG